MSTTYEQLLRAKTDLETSLERAQEFRDQWLALVGPNGDNYAKLSKKELGQSTKTFENKLLAVKWDLQDLEAQLATYKFDDNTQRDELASDAADEIRLVEEIRRQIGDWREELLQMMSQRETVESSSKLFNKHGITFHHNPVAAAINHSISAATNNNNNNKYERLSSSHQADNMEDVVQFDKSLVSPGRQETSIVNNLLYDHLEDQQQQQHRASLSDPSQVFNNLSRPVVTNVYMNPNENEMILDMLETEYYNPPDGLLQQQNPNNNNNNNRNRNSNNSTRIDTMFKKLFDTDRNKFLGTIVFLCSFPTLLILFMFA